ncbi:MAG: hypothetical protein DMG62_00395 [Acidobacteria bacterium]|nr:MAG: hypothetical protein DMG62_00395 [Acidobacteriota bacterium]
MLSGLFTVEINCGHEKTMRYHLLSLALLILSVCPISLGQSSGEQTKDNQLDKVTRTFRPKLLLQDALKIADNYIGDEHIDISHYWLYEVRYTVYGEKGKGQPAWHIWWVSDRVAVGDYVEIVVFMDGKAWRKPSM